MQTQIRFYYYMLVLQDFIFSGPKLLVYMSHVMRRPLCIYENKGADQLHGNFIVYPKFVEYYTIFYDIFLTGVLSGRRKYH